MPDFVPGPNKPSPVSRVLILGYYDGATDGVMQLGDGGPVYRFDWTDEAHNPDGMDVRTYLVRPLPVEAFDRLVSVIGAHIPTAWPAWLPAWEFPSRETQAEVERQVDAILAQAGEAVWRITTGDAVEFGRVNAEPVGVSARVA